MPISPQELDILKRFLSFPLNSAEEVLEQFRALPGSVVPEEPPSELEQFVYVPGKRPDRVLLVAHADTVWDDLHLGSAPVLQRIASAKNHHGHLILSGENSEIGLGADDRAGCAIVWLLQESGHSLLILNGEERGQLAANYMKNACPDLFEEINEHQFALQFDRRNGADYKVYYLPVSDAFHQYIKKNTSYEEPDHSSRTDICVLCQDICGANLSIGYYDEHTNNEHLNVNEWNQTLTLTRAMLANYCPPFPLVRP